jgi:hypothetical protein
VAYGNGTFVAVGTGGVKQTSTNGISWSAQTGISGGTDLLHVYYGADKFVAVGASGKIFTSPDGGTWTQRTSGFTGSQNILGGTYANGLYLAVGEGNKLSISSDGISWSQPSNPFSGTLFAAVYGNGLFLAGGNNGELGTSPYPGTTTVLTLTNTTDLSNIQLGDTVVEVGGGADATGTVVAINTGTPSITVAPSSANWTGGVGATAKDTSRTISVTAAPLISTNQISGVTPISANWTQQTSSFGADALYGVTYGNSFFVAVGDQGKLATSTNGTSWTQQTSSFGTAPILGATYGNSIYVIVGGSGKLATSSNGTAWTQQTSSFGNTFSDTINGVTYGNGIFVAGGNNGKLATSSNGIAWTQQTSSFGTDTILKATYANGIFVAVGASGKLATSSNGTAWTQQTSGFGTDTIWDAAYGKGLYVAVGNAGKLATSSNGTTWTLQTSSFGTDPIYGVTYANNTFVAVGFAGKLATSPDGITWTQQTSSFGTDALRTVTYGAGTFVAVGNVGKLATSTLPAGGTSLTIAGADADGFYVGNTISNGVTGASAASGLITSINSTTVVVTPPSANWANGQNLYMGVPLVDVTGDTSNLTSYFIPEANLAPSSTYYARVKYNSLTTSSQWSAWASFGTASAFTPFIGAQVGGGYFAGQINDGGTIYNLIVAPKEGNTSGPATGGALKGQYGGTSPTGIQYKTTNSADLVADQNQVYGGTTSDRLKASGVHPLFNTTWLNNSAGPNGGTMNLATGGAGGGSGIGGYTDWYVPAKNELEVLYYYLKPNSTGSQPNDTSSGSNPNAVAPEPVSTNYTATNPAQTTATAFQGTNAQAFSSANAYWSSSEFSSSTVLAWIQDFFSGSQFSSVKANPYYARAVRRVAA